mgnify:CR=1 FL=1
MNLVYLIMTKAEMSDALPTALLPLINARNAKHGFQFSEGETWKDLHTKYDEHPNTGSGVEREKGGVPYWYLPFEGHEAMANFPQLTVLTADEIRVFGFDEIIEDDNA